jgi:hypothetical protein
MLNSTHLCGADGRGEAWAPTVCGGHVFGEVASAITGATVHEFDAAGHLAASCARGELDPDPTHY